MPLDELLAGPGALLWWAKVGIAVAAASAAALLAVPALRRWAYPPLDTSSLAEHILFDRVLEDGHTIRCTDGSLIATISVAGMDLASMSPEDQERHFRRRKQWIDSLGEFKGLSVMVLANRRFSDAAGDSGAFDNRWLAEIERRWRSGFERSFRNSYLVVLWVKGGRDGARAVLEHAVGETLTALSDYGPALLSAGEPGRPSPLFGAWGALLNPGRRVTALTLDGSEPTDDEGSRPWRARANFHVASNVGPRLGFGDRLAHDLIASAVAFNHGRERTQDDGVIEFRRGPEAVFMAAIGIGTYGGESTAAIVQRILSLDAELLLAQWFTVYDQATGMQKVKELARRDINSRATSLLGGSTAAAADFMAATELLDKRGAGGASLCYHQMHVFVLGTSRQDLEERVERVRAAFGNFEINGVREGPAAEPLWFSLFPPHLEMTRGKNLMSHNVAHFVTFEMPSQGLTECDWGPRPVAMFKSARGMPYALAFHRDNRHRAEGHMVMIGGTGSGKTTLANFLTVAALGYPGLHAYTFDRGDASYSAVRAFGGSYIHLHTDTDQVETNCTINPFRMEGFRPVEEGSEETNFLISWVRDHLCGTTDPQAEEEITRVLNRMASEPAEERSIVQLYRNLPPTLPAREQIRKFVEGQYAWVFPPGEDTFGATAARWVGIDFSRVLQDPVLVNATLPYLSYRIEKQMRRQGTPFLMMLDETAALLTNKVFQAWFERMLREHRRDRGVVVSLFQDVGPLVEHGVLELVLGQCATTVIFPNVNAMETPYIEGMRLTRSEFEMVRGNHPLVGGLKKYVLVRRREGSVVLDVDLSGPLGPLLKLFRSGQGAADEVRSLERQFPDGDWVARLVGEATRRVAA